MPGTIQNDKLNVIDINLAASPQKITRAGRVIRVLRTLTDPILYPLFVWSIVKKHFTLAKILVPFIKDVDRHKASELSPLQAVASRKVEIVKALLNRGADPNKKCIEPEGFTPLYWGIWGGHSEIVNLLLAHGANQDIANNKESTIYYALNNAHETNREVIITSLIKAGANPNLGRTIHNEEEKSTISPLFKLCSDLTKDSIAKISFLLDFDQLDPNEGGSSWKLQDGTWIKTASKTPLYTLLNVCFTNQDEDSILSIVDKLIDKGADPNLGSVTDDFIISPLSLIVSRDKTRLAEKLLKKNAHPEANSKNDGKGWLLWVAISMNNISMLKLLLEYGADAKTHDKYLMWAAEGNVEMKKLLIQYGATPVQTKRPEFFFWPKPI